MHCQQCRAYLEVDSTLNDLSPTAWKLLLEASSRSTRSDTDKTSTASSSYSTHNHKEFTEAMQSATNPLAMRSATLPNQALTNNRGVTPIDNGGMSFVLLTESQMDSSGRGTQIAAMENHQGTRRRKSAKDSHVEGGTLSNKMESTSRIFEILSSQSDVDHPICVECTDILIGGMEKRLANVTRERDVYAEYLKNARADAPTDEEQAEVDREVASLRERENSLFAALEQLESEKAALEDELADLELESRSLDHEVEEFWRERNALAQVLQGYQSERDSLNLRYDNDSRQLNLLQRTNVFNDTFNIAYDKDGIATINGLRLGRSSGKSVDWAEINAAWGQALLLLVVVAEKLNYTFIGYRLNPMGSTSTIDRFESANSSPTNSAKQSVDSLSLYYSSEFPLSIGFLHRSFDAAMIAFLECVRQLGIHIERTVNGADKVKKIPFEIRKDKIGDLSIRLGSFNGDESWTTACKRTLLNCKFLLAHASHMEPARRTDQR